MILSNVEIQRALDDGRLMIDPEPTPRTRASTHSACPYQTSAVDLTLSSLVSIYKGNSSPVVIDLTMGGFEGLEAVMDSRTNTGDHELRAVFDLAATTNADLPAHHRRGSGNAVSE